MSVIPIQAVHTYSMYSVHTTKRKKKRTIEREMHASEQKVSEAIFHPSVVPSLALGITVTFHFGVFFSFSSQSRPGHAC